MATLAQQPPPSLASSGKAISMPPMSMPASSRTGDHRNSWRKNHPYEFSNIPPGTYPTSPPKKTVYLWEFLSFEGPGDAGKGGMRNRGVLGHLWLGKTCFKLMDMNEPQRLEIPGIRENGSTSVYENSS